MHEGGLVSGESQRRSRILVVEDEEGIRDVWMEVLGDAGYSVVGAEDGQEALRRVARIRPDLILLDMVMPGIDGAAVLERLRADPTGRAVPVLIVSALATGVAARLSGREQELGIAGILSKPLAPGELLAHVGRALALTRRPAVLVVEDEAGLRRLEQRLLEEEGCDVDTAADGRQALTLLAGRTYDAIILDLRVPHVNGQQIATEVRHSEPNRRTPIIMVTGTGDAEARRKGFENHVVLYLHKPFTAEAFRAAIRGVLD